MELNKLKDGLKHHGYIIDDNTAMILQYTMMLKKPLLIEGPAGAGKTELGKAWSRYSGSQLIRLQCYEGIDESKALYEWNYQKQLLYIQTNDKGKNEWDTTSSNIYTQEFLLKRPLLKAISSPDPSVLLIDEIDKSDEEFESFLLEILSDWQITIPELGTIPAVSIPTVILTSNGARNLSQALRRRCIYLYLDYPNEQRELDIIRIHFPMLDEQLGKQAVIFIRKLRLEKIKKHPSISEVIDWMNILEKRNITLLSDDIVAETLNILLKYQEDCLYVTEKMKQKDWFNGIFNN